MAECGLFSGGWASRLQSSLDKASSAFVASVVQDATLGVFLAFLSGVLAGAFVTYCFALRDADVGRGAAKAVTKRAAPTCDIAVSGLFVYPIKSCAGVAVDSALITPRGFEHDRLYMIVDANRRFVSQRKCPRMALIRPTVTASGGLFIATDNGKFELTPRTKGDTVIVTVWRSDCAAIDQGDEAANFLAEFMGMPDVRLVVRCQFLGAIWICVMRNGIDLFSPFFFFVFSFLQLISDECVREVEPGYVTPRVYQTTFSDGYPFLITSEASLTDLAEKVGRDISMNRFRPNIVLKGGMGPFDEDYWETLKIGNSIFTLPKICSRCKIPTVDPEKGTFDSDNQPTVALRKFRRAGQKVLFGQNAVCARGEGMRISIGEKVTVESLHLVRKV